MQRLGVSRRVRILAAVAAMAAAGLALLPTPASADQVNPISIPGPPPITVPPLPVVSVQVAGVGVTTPSTLPPALNEAGNEVIDTVNTVTSDVVTRPDAA